MFGKKGEIEKMNYSVIQILNLKKQRKFQIISIFLLMIFIFIPKTSAQDEDIYPIPEYYNVEGIPIIKKSEVEKLFYDPKSIKSNLIWDGDEKNRRLFVTDETNHVYLIDKPLKEPVKLLKKVIPNRVKASSNGRYFAFTDDSEDKDNFQLSIFNINGEEIKRLSKLTGKDESVESFLWNDKGDKLIYSQVDYETKKTKLCENDLKKITCFQVELNGIWFVADTLNELVLLKYWKASSSQQLFLFNTKTNKLTSIDEQGNSRRAFLTKDWIVWTSEGNSNCKVNPCILLKDLQRGQIEQLNFPNQLFSINDLKISPHRDHFLIQETTNGFDSLRIFKIEKNKRVKELPQFISDSYVIWNTRWLTNDEVVYTLENIGTPSSIQSFNFKLNRTTDWSKGKLPDQLKDKVNPPKLIKWRSFDNVEITGYIVSPKPEPKKSPVLIYIHGGPQIIDQPVFSSQDIRLSSNLGLKIIHTNIRGSSGFGKDFMDSDNKDKRGNAIKDIQTLIDWIEKQPGLDSDNIFLRGESYGGFVALSTALQEPKRIKGVIAEYPLISIRSYLSQSWIDEFAINEYGDPKDEKLMCKLDELSPLNNQERWNNIPLFLTRGKQDSRSFEKDVIDLKNQLQSKNTEVWFIYSTKDGHGFGSNYITAAMYKFLQKRINKER
jgi:dipeptidyl aminopeptidase/acylaminoacyl peptidase